MLFRSYPQSGRAQPGPTYINPQSGRTPPRVKTSPQNGRTQPGSNSYKIHSGQTPTRVKTYPQSGRAQPGLKLINPQSGRTPPRVKTSTQNGRTQPRSNLYIHKVDRLQLGSRPRRGRTQQGSNLFQMNGSNEGSKSHSIGLMDTTKIKNLLQVYEVDGHR